jgi:hypothetical protein
MAVWNSTATGPNGLVGAVVGGQGMTSPRIRPLAVVDMGHFDETCAGATCRVKVANIVGFFVEGVCSDVDAALRLIDPHMPCPVGNEDAAIVGRIVTVPAMYATGGGTVELSAAFLRVVRLLR